MITKTVVRNEHCPPPNCLQAEKHERDRAIVQLVMSLELSNNHGVDYKFKKILKKSLTNPQIGEEVGHVVLNLDTVSGYRQKYVQNKRSPKPKQIWH